MFSCEDRKSNCCASAALCARAKTLFCRTCALNWQPPVILSGQQISRIISQEDIIFGGKWLSEITGKTSSSIRAKFPKKMLRVVWKGGSYEEIRKTRSNRNTLVVSMDHAYSSSKLILCQRKNHFDFLPWALVDKLTYKILHERTWFFIFSSKLIELLFFLKFVLEIKFYYWL